MQSTKDIVRNHVLKVEKIFLITAITKHNAISTGVLIVYVLKLFEV